ncbi:MAG: leucine-rich repeat domain-containing protein [Paludibacteraceae bacterium]
MRTKHLLPLLVLLLTTLSTHAYDFQSGDLYYNITSDSTVAVTYQKSWSNTNYEGLITASIPKTVTDHGYAYTVTSIESEAFSFCSTLTSITIPNSITSIKLVAFANCKSLISMIVESGNTMYDSRNNCNAIIETATNTLIAGCQSTTIPNSVTSIGEYAFYMCSSLTSITIPESVSSLESYAFYECSNLADIYCYATTPPVCKLETCEGNIFKGVNKHCRIHVPAGTIKAYQWAPEWRDFYHFYEMSELPEGTPTDQVGVTVTGNYATFTWPINPTASSYTLTITKDGEVFCTLIFNNMGQLVGMAFAPARDSKPSANQSDAQSTAYGFSFVVTNLDANSHYTYTFTVNGADSEVIETYSGSFDTSEETAIPATQQDNQLSRKVLRNGQVLILRNGETYDMMGQRL